MKSGHSDRHLPYIYIAPAVILMIFLTLLPNLYSFYLSFTNYSLFHFKQFEFVGLRIISASFQGLNSAPLHGSSSGHWSGHF